MDVEPLGNEGPPETLVKKLADQVSTPLVPACVHTVKKQQTALYSCFQRVWCTFTAGGGQMGEVWGSSRKL